MNFIERENLESSRDFQADADFVQGKEAPSVAIENDPNVHLVRDFTSIEDTYSKQGAILPVEVTERRRVIVTKEMFADPEQFAAVYDQLRTPLLGIISSFRIPREEAEDLMHESLLHAVNKLDLYIPERGSFTAWLYTITKNLTRDYLRKTKRQPIVIDMLNGTIEEVLEDIDSGEISTEEQVLFSERSEKLYKAIDKLGELSADQKQIITFTLQGKTQSEIAATLGIPIGTVKTRDRLGKKTLRRLLHDQKDFLLD